MLTRLIDQATPGRIEHAVLTLFEGGRLAEHLVGRGVEVRTLGLDPDRRNLAQAAIRAMGLLPRLRPDVLSGWLHHGNVLAGLLSLGQGGTPCVMNFRSTFDQAELSRPVMRVLRRLSPRADLRLANSRTAAYQLEEAGFGPVRFLPNGFSTEEFSPSQEKRTSLRTRLGIPLEALVVGHVGRAHPVKNQLGLLQAFLRVAGGHPRAHLLFAGRGLPELLGPHNSLPERVHLLPELGEPSEVYAAADVYAHASLAESFPNVIGEAMLMQLPVLCTDVAATRHIVEGRNVVVPPGRVDLLAEGLRTLLSWSDAERAELGASNRTRMRTLFSLEGAVTQFEDLFLSVRRGA